MAKSFDAAVRVAAAKGTAGQDRACALDLGGRFVVAVADGAGAGAVISAVQAAVRKAKFDPASTAAWTALLTDADDELWRGDEGHEASATVLFTNGDVIVGASVGSTQAKVTGRGAWMDLTRRQKPEPLLGSGNAEPIAFEVRLKAAELSLIAATEGWWSHAPVARLDEAIGAGAGVEQTVDALARAGGEALALVLLQLRR